MQSPLGILPSEITKIVSTGVQMQSTNDCRNTWLIVLAIISLRCLSSEITKIVSTGVQMNGVQMIIETLG